MQSGFAEAGGVDGGSSGGGEVLRKYPTALSAAAAAPFRSTVDTKSTAMDSLLRIGRPCGDGGSVVADRPTHRRARPCSANRAARELK